MQSNIKFRLEHLDKYAIIDSPCTLLVRCNSRPTMDSILSNTDNPRWVINLCAVLDTSLDTLKLLDAQGLGLTYGDIGYLLLKGSIWQEQVNNDIDLPCKGEEVIAVFDYVEDRILCTGITLIPRREPVLYHFSQGMKSEYDKFEDIIKNLR